MAAPGAPNGVPATIRAVGVTETQIVLDNGIRIPIAAGNVSGDYYQLGAKADYGLNTRTRLTFEVVNRRFRADGGATNSDYDENLASIALIRHLR